MILGYARVSTEDQNLDAQLDALKASGAQRIFSDKISGSLRKRPELDRLLDQLREGDVIVATKYDRLARSLPTCLTLSRSSRRAAWVVPGGRTRQRLPVAWSSTPCLYRSVRAREDWGNEDYSKGYFDGQTDGIIACNQERRN